MKPIQHGTCGGEWPCRWAAERPDDRLNCHHTDDSIPALVRIDTKAPGYGAGLNPDWWCSLWEPPEGMVCGNCELMRKGLTHKTTDGIRMTVDGCELDGRPRHPLDSCDNHRWTPMGGCDG